MPSTRVDLCRRCTSRTTRRTACAACLDPTWTETTPKRSGAICSIETSERGVSATEEAGAWARGVRTLRRAVVPTFAGSPSLRLSLHALDHAAFGPGGVARCGRRRVLRSQLCTRRSRLSTKTAAATLTTTPTARLHPLRPTPLGLGLVGLGQGARLELARETIAVESTAEACGHERREERSARLNKLRLCAGKRTVQE